MSKILTRAEIADFMARLSEYDLKKYDLDDRFTSYELNEWHKFNDRRKRFIDSIEKNLENMTKFIDSENFDLNNFDLRYLEDLDFALNGIKRFFED